MGGSGVRRTSSALVGFEQTVGIDLSLERQPERASSSLRCLARVVCRVESVCTDPSAKCPTGPFGLVHPECFLVLPTAAAVALPGGSRWRSCPAGSASARSIVGPLSCLASSFWLRPRKGPGSGGVARQGLRLCRHRPKWKAICVPSCVPNSPMPGLPTDTDIRCQGTAGSERWRPRELHNRGPQNCTPAATKSAHVGL